MKQKTKTYKMIVAVFEQYGFYVVPNIDEKTIILSNITKNRLGSIPRKTIQLIAMYEDLNEYVADIEPFQVAGWKITLW
jgi:hypothetical protein